MDDLELAALQAALVDALGRAESPAAALEILGAAEVPEWSRAWLMNSDPRALETAIDLLRRWAEHES